jgi:hypothetical protein
MSQPSYVLDDRGSVTRAGKFIYFRYFKAHPILYAVSTECGWWVVTCSDQEHFGAAVHLQIETGDKTDSYFSKTDIQGLDPDRLQGGPPVCVSGETSAFRNAVGWVWLPACPLTHAVCTQPLGLRTLRVWGRRICSLSRRCLRQDYPPMKECRFFPGRSRSSELILHGNAVGCLRCEERGLRTSASRVS